MTVTAVANTTRVHSAIRQASARTGIDFDYLLGQAEVESGLNASARAGTSSATGLYQFIEQSWLAVVKQHGAEHGLGWAANSIGQTAGGRMTVSDAGTRQAILALRSDPEVASLMAASHAADNKAAIEQSLGREATGTDLYMAHFLGLGGAKQFLSAMESNPGRPAASLFPAAARANRGVFYDRDGVARSLGDVYRRFSMKLGEGAGATGDALPQPALASRTLGMNGATVVTGMGEDASDALEWASITLDRFGGARPAAAAAATALRPTPDTARLAYMMLASLGA